MHKKTVTIVALGMLASLSACASAFPNSHPGHSRDFGCSSQVSIPTGDSAGPGMGGTYTTTVNHSC